MTDSLSTNKNTDIVIIGREAVSIEDVYNIAYLGAKVKLDPAPEYKQWIDAGAAVIDRMLQSDGYIYGVTTGYGDSVTVDVSVQQAYELPNHLYTFHGCGMGDYFSEAEGRAILVARLVSLARGYSGVSWALLEQLSAFLNLGITPLIPEEGSVGASGDLTPLSYVVAALCGHREVYFNGQQIPAAQALEECGLIPHTLRPKEGLALMNGTAVMTAIACINLVQAQRLVCSATQITALNVIAMEGNAFHFDELLFATKPHQGMGDVAEQLRALLGVAKAPKHSKRLQDRYSLRCAPHVIGVLADALPHYRKLITAELNSSNDNPIIDPESGSVLHGGHFYGGHIAHCMDSMKTDVANIADLLDRQLAQSVDEKFNHGLPRNLSGSSAQRAALNHGFKAVQIGVSSWTAEALKHTMPASVFSRSTECHNQDKVSMGTIAARDCRRVMKLTQQVTSATLLAACQGVYLREADVMLLPKLKGLYDSVFSIAPPLIEDRPLEHDLRRLLHKLEIGFFDEV